MAEITEAFARQILKDTAEARTSPLTQWEKAQFAWWWLKSHGHKVSPDILIDAPRRAHSASPPHSEGI